MSLMVILHLFFHFYWSYEFNLGGLVYSYPSSTFPLGYVVDAIGPGHFFSQLARMLMCDNSRLNPWPRSHLLGGRGERRMGGVGAVALIQCLFNAGLKACFPALKMVISEGLTQL